MPKLTSVHLNYSCKSFLRGQLGTSDLETLNMHAHTYAQRVHVRTEGETSVFLQEYVQLWRSSHLGCGEECQDTAQGGCSTGSVGLRIVQHQLLICAHLQVGGS